MCKALIDFLKMASVLVRRRAEDEFLSYLRALPIMTPPEAMLMIGDKWQEKPVDMQKDLI